MRSANKSVAGVPETVLGAFACAPVNADAEPILQEQASAPVVGIRPGPPRRNQLAMNSNVTTTLVAPCNKPIRLARVPDGIAIQSTRPKIAAGDRRDCN